MNRQDRDLRRLAQEFQDEQRSFGDFHEAFLSRWTEIYSRVLTTLPDPVRDEDLEHGVIGEAELRRRLRRHPLLADRP